MKRQPQPKLSKAKLKSGTKVQVLSGKAKGQVGEVLQVDLRRHAVTIKDVNMVKRHTKPRSQEDKGGILSIEAPVHMSNVAQYCETCHRGVRKLCDAPGECKYNQKG